MTKKLNLDNLNEINPVDMFISKEPIEQVKEQITTTSEATIVSKPQKTETKSKRLNLLTKPSTYEKLKVIAKKYGVSVNDLINQFLEQDIKKECK